MGRVRARKRVKIGSRRLHVALSFTQAGFSSWSVKVGPWSWNSRARRHRVDLPGPWHWEGSTERQRAARRMERQRGRHRGRYRDGAERSRGGDGS